MVTLSGALASGGCASVKERAVVAEQARESNPGPCPRAFAIYEAARVVKFRGDGQRYANVGFTAEMGNVRSLCRYYGSAPINADLEIDMSFGRGPAAAGEATHTYNYFVAVTRKNIAVIEKQYFPITVTFPDGVSVMETTERLESIVIPRLKETTSGANFEIIVGYELTPSQKEFNEAGKRFRVSAGAN
jgi:hypothetical protein